jgi:cell division protein ZapB
MLPPSAALLTPACNALYICRMSTEQKSQHIELELQRLQKRLDELVKVCGQLKEENRSLKQRQDILMSERANLLQKNDQVRGRVEAMINRLKGMEHTA